MGGLKAEHFINRELSWLEFNQRVLDEALDPTNPLLERLKYFCIVGSNLDEFFEVLTLVQTQHIPQFPLILFCSEHWKGLLAWMKSRLNKDRQISPGDLELVKLTDDVDEVIAIIRDYERRVGPPGTLPVAFA